MTVQILQSKPQVKSAREELRHRGLSCISSRPLQLLRQFGLAKGISVGDIVKSWDVLTTTKFVEANIALNEPIVDVGAYASEILCVLHRLGYSNLVGVDLNPQLRLMPYSDIVHYENADFMHTSFPSCSFAAVTAVSVIEHGFDIQRLLGEVWRLLRPGGYFVASFDYWPEKLDTSGIELFGMDWSIFSRADVESFLDEAGRKGFKPVGAIELDAGGPTMRFAGREYTFAWLALRKAYDADCN